MQTDPIADMLTCMRNAIHARKEWVEIPWSRLKEGICKVMHDEGFIKEYSVLGENQRRSLRIWLKYDKAGRSVLRGLKRESKPSLRTYIGADRIPLVQKGFGISVLSTSRGIVVDREARRLRVGGEILCSLW